MSFARGAAWYRRQLLVRVLSLVAMGMLLPVLVMGWAARTSLAALEQRILTERELLARSLAQSLGRLLGSELEALHNISSEPHFDLEDSDLGPERSALREFRVRHHELFDELFLVDRSGALLASEAKGPLARDVAPLIAEALRSARPSVTSLLDAGAGAFRLYALVPIKTWRGEVAGLLAGGIDPASERLTGFVRTAALQAGESIDLVDARGAVIATTDEDRLFSNTDHADIIAGFIREGRPTAGRCHGCHTPGKAEPQREVMAFAPLAIAPWGVSIRQPEEQAFASAGKVSSNVLTIGALLVVVALLFAFGAVRSVTQPVGMLTAAAERVAWGELAQPIPNLGVDEIGRLSVSLERMRKALADSLSRVEKTNAELDARVRDRTQELERLYKELREREESRGQLLRKVITAQEDERRRIARELHDETTQSLAALVLALETALRAPGTEEGVRRLGDAKQLAVRSLDEVHRIIRDLRPSVLDDLGLRSAIRWYAEQVLKPRGIAARCEFTGVEERLPAQMSIAVFRVVQETLTNIAKHAGAETVLIQCTLNDGALTIEIEDDGRGFDPAQAAPRKDGGGWGLLGMKERIELLGGDLQIDSAPDQGTRVVLKVRVPDEAAHGEDPRSHS